MYKFTTKEACDKESQTLPRGRWWDSTSIVDGGEMKWNEIVLTTLQRCTWGKEKKISMCSISGAAAMQKPYENSVFSNSQILWTHQHWLNIQCVNRVLRSQHSMLIKMSTGFDNHRLLQMDNTTTNTSKSHTSCRFFSFSFFLSLLYHFNQFSQSHYRAFGLALILVNVTHHIDFGCMWEMVEKKIKSPGAFSRKKSIEI